MYKFLKLERKIDVILENEDGYEEVIELDLDTAHELYSQLGEQLGLNFVKLEEPSVEFVPQEIKKVESNQLKVEDFSGYSSSRTSDLGMNIDTNVTDDIYAEFRTFLKENDTYDKYFKNRFDPEVNIDYISVIEYPYGYIWSAFNHSSSPEGFHFWNDLDIKWRDHLNSLQE